MNRYQIFHLVFLVSFMIQAVFSGEWMLSGERTIWLVCLSLAGVLFVIYKPQKLDLWSGKMVLSLAVLSGAYSTLNSIYLNPSVTASWGIWLYVFILLFLAWEVLGFWSRTETRLKPKSALAIDLLVPLLFGGMLLYLWEFVTIGLQVPQVLLPSPSLIGRAFANSLGMLWDDFQQTFMKAVLAGYFLGCGSGFITAILVDRVPFLQRGLLPLGNLASALPIVGVAPIMVMWFGFDWQSKAAVVVIMTFFPMLVNTLTGLAATNRMELDLMHSYAANYWQTLFMVRLPNSLPFIFNALKINSTLALIGAIVAEFFGTPIVGMGFRISTEIGRMNVDIVWATIAVAALSGSLFYALLALLERRLTGWHPSLRMG